MRHPHRHCIVSVALLMLGSAALLFSCTQQKLPEEDTETLMTQQSDTLTMINSKNGKKSYRFYTPLMEYYELAKEPYMEFRMGIDVVTYDSLGHIESTLVADYAINYEKQSLWETKGNVLAVNKDGQILETQQLFWNQKTGRIWSNVDSKITQGGDVIIGEGFESDEKMEDFTFRKPKGKVLVDIEPTRSDSTQTADTPPPPI